MSLLRYAAQERANIAAAETRAKRQAAAVASTTQKRQNAAQSAALSCKLEWTDAPSSASAPGSAGQIAYDSDYLYICVAADSWTRAALETW